MLASLDGTVRGYRRKSKRKDTQVPQLSGPTENVVDEAVYKEMDESLVRAATTTSSLEVEQDSGNINKTPSKATPNELSFQETNSGGGPRCQEALEDTISQTRSERVFKLLMIHCSQEGRISDIDADQGITLVSTHDDADKDLHGEEVFVTKQDENFVEKEVHATQVQVKTAATTATISIDEVTLAQALVELKHTKPKAKAKRIIFHELKESTTIVTTTIPKTKSQDKGRIKTCKRECSKRTRSQKEQEVKLVKIIPDEEEVEIDAIPLAVKPPSIVDWKIHKEGKKSYYKIIRADGSLKIYLVSSHMLKSFDREDVETLWKLVKAKHGSTMLFPIVRSTTLNDKVIVTLSRLKVTMRETLFERFTPKVMQKLTFDDQEE
uniref:Uncharacterized protein n=1 Tax=Tanacetum cinerariifolium TaxID=118510 RepID=A0A6L2KP85_TANCI|nr:hypothetical protein [Tanacetum cinerariifolium]